MMNNKKIKVFLVIMTFFVLITGCGKAQNISQAKETEVQAQKKEEDLQAIFSEIIDTFGSYEKVAKKYGEYSVSTSVTNDLTNNHFSYEEITDGKGYTCISYETGKYDIKLNDVYYQGMPTDDGISFAEYVNYDEENRYILLLEEYNSTGIWISEIFADGDIKKTSEGYTIELSYTDTDDDNGELNWTAIASVNEDLSLRDIKCECSNAEGVFYVETSSFKYNVDKPSVVTDCQSILKKSNGETRSVTYYIVENGKVVDTYISDVPVGLYATAIFPEKYVDETYKLFDDIECSQPSSLDSCYEDSEVYVLTDKEEDRIANSDN